MTSKRSLFTKLVPVLFVATLLIVATFASSAANLPFFGGTASNSIAPQPAGPVPGQSAPGSRYAALMNSLAPLTATVQTDKADYQPGQYVVVTGSGWWANETVRLTFSDGHEHGDHVIDTVADANGNISNSDFLVTEDQLGNTITLTANGLSSNQEATTTFTDNVVVDWKQSANNETNGTITGLGNIHWIGSIVQGSNSTYFEGMSNLQRALFTDVPATTGNIHTLTFDHQSTKGGIHAYDFLTSWTQAVADDAAALGVAIQLNPCGEDIGPPGSLGATCVSLRGSAVATAGPGACPTCVVDVVIPDDPYVSKDGSTATKIAAYEAGHGNRTIRLYGNTPISGASIAVCHDVAAGADTGDSFVKYVLTWTSTSDEILVETAGHLAVTGDGTGDSWGPGLGSSQIAGGPYHFRLNQLGGAVTDGSTCPATQGQVTSLGSQDNQIKGADILVQPPPCEITGPATACAGATPLNYTANTGTGFTHAWSFVGSANGATFCSGTTSSTVCVTAGTGDFTLQVEVTNSGGTTTCTTLVTVSNPQASSVKTDVSCNGGSNGSMTVTIAGGAAPFTCSLDGGAFAPCTSGDVFGGLSAGLHTVSVLDSLSCPTSTSQTITQPDALGLVLTPTPASCNGALDGSISAAVTGTPLSDLEINIDGGTFADVAASPVVFGGLGAGNHTVILRRKSANSCSTSQIANVTQPDALGLVLTPTPASCNGAGDGSISAAITGTPLSDLEINIDGGAFADVVASPVVFSGLSAASHTVILRRKSANSCSTSESATVTQPDALVLTLGQTDISCNGASDGTITVSVSGGTPAYQCKLDAGSFAACPLAYTGVGPGLHTVVAQDANGCSDTKQVTITEPAELTVSLGDVTCGTGSTITATVNGGTFPYTYAWEIQGGTFNPAPGPNDASATYDTQAGTVIIKVTVTDNNGCTAEFTSQADCAVHEVFCTLTQGAYGNAKGKTYLGDQLVNRLQLITALLETDIVLGVVGEKSLTIPGGTDAATSAACIIKRLPGGTSAKELYGDDTPAPLDRTLDSSCNTNPQPAGLNKNGRWENILLTQTLTLELNTRLDDHGDAGLRELELCRYMAARNAVVVIDQNGHVTYEDTADNCPENITAVGLPEAVMAELGAGATVQDLLDLANRALAGLPTDSTLTEIAGAVGAINELFDECKFLIYCSDTTPFTFPLPCLASAPAVNGSQVNTSAQTATPAILPEVFRRDSFRSLISRDGFLSNIMRTDHHAYGSS